MATKREQELEAGIAGLAGYIKYGDDTGITEVDMLTTVAHDLLGLAARKAGFLPRTHRFQDAQSRPIAAKEQEEGKTDEV